MRSTDPWYTNILNQIRVGQVTPEICDFLDSRVKAEAATDCMHLYSHNANVEKRNVECLKALNGCYHYYTTCFERGSPDLIKKAFPWLTEELCLKRGARVMIRKNDPEGQYVNGSVGTVAFLGSDMLWVDLTTGVRVALEVADFSLSDEAGFIYAHARNFPVSLAYATSIHKSQGATLESAYLDISQAWEPGQAYVALSRVKSAEGLFLKDWSKGAITRLDSKVTAFHKKLFKEAVKINLTKENA
jgi:hypothetical protein